MEQITHSQLARRKRNSPKVNLIISVVLHVVVLGLAFVWAAKEGMMGKTLQTLTADIIKNAKKVEQAKKDGAATIARLKAMPTDDDCFGAGSIRADGRKIHPSYLWEVKKPSESKGPWDYYKPVATTPADKSFRPLDKGGCPLVKA